MRKKHYHAGYNTPGYIPEMDVETHFTKKSARSAMSRMKRDFLEDDWWEGGKPRYTASGSAKSGRIDIADSSSIYALGVVIWMRECNGVECLTEEEE